MVVDRPIISRDNALKALRLLLREPVSYHKTPRELFSPDYIYGDATKDRAVALVAATILDQFLKTALLARFVKLNSTEDDEIFGPSDSAPLSSFSARIKVAYALGIYDRDFRKDLDMIRNIRNVFAHAHGHVDFHTPAVVDACACLKSPCGPMWDFLYGKNPTARNRYIYTAMVRSLLLLSPPKEESDTTKI
jgi:DNA-binding MltR family transcriptional regulator